METSNFAQRLAANEQTKRDRAIKKLRNYITAKSKKGGGFSQDELLQLWKGLHYCFWMQDKPLLQEELSTKLCGLLKAFPDVDSALRFAAAFFTTQAREWGRLDQWRMDKYMMLIREFLRSTLELVKSKQWETSCIDAVSAMMEAVMDAGKEEYPDGLRLHLADIYLDEIEKVGQGELSGDHINTLLEPFIQYVVNSKRDAIANQIISKVFGSILSSVQTNQEENEEDETASPELQYNLSGLQQMIFEAGRQSIILPKVRRKLYRLVKRFSAAGGKGVQPSELQTKRKHADVEEKDEPTKKRKKKSTTLMKEDVKQGKEEDKIDREEEEEEENAAASPQKKVKETPVTPSGKKTKKKKNKKQQEKKSCEELSPSTPKHVAFDLERNSSRGLREFVKNTSSNPTPPYLPSRSPSHSILKESPAVASPVFHLAETPRTGSPKRKNKKKNNKNALSSSSPQDNRMGHVFGRQQKLAVKKFSRLSGKKSSGGGGGGSKFNSKKKGKSVMRQPKRR